MKAYKFTEIAEGIRNNSIDFARLKLTQSKQKLDLEDLFHEKNFFCMFKSGLAESVCRVFGEHDQNVFEAYFFEPYVSPVCETGEEFPVDGNLNLLLVVKTKTAGLDAFITSLDRALTETLKELPLPFLKSYQSVLNVIPITVKDIENRRGYAALLSSFFAPPLKVWERKNLAKSSRY